MKIGIDVSLAVGEKAGVGHYSWELVNGLGEIDHENEYILYPLFYNIRDPKFKSLPIVGEGNFHMQHTEHSAQQALDLWNDTSVVKKDLLGRVDILHATTVCAPRDHYGKLVSTAYDVSFMTHPQYHTEANRAVCLKGTLDSALYADKIVAISEHTKEDIKKYFNVSDDRITVIYLAPGRNFKPIEDRTLVQRMRETYRLEKEYILMVGSIEPRKNHRGLLQAYRAMPEAIQNRYDLVFTGGTGWLNTDIYNLVRELHLEDRVRFLGYVPDQHLPLLYNGATLFVFPSFYEGFGLPVAEAMACGTPVITSNVSSLPEIVGDSDLLVDPGNVRDLLDKLVRNLQQFQGGTIHS